MAISRIGDKFKKINMLCKWKEAATIILTSLNRTKDKSLFNYDLLTLKRSAKISFMPGTHVFPGGASHPADSSGKWLEIFARLNVKHDIKLNNTDAPPILMGGKDEIPKLASLKITAVRETFEETGILLCRKNIGGGDWISSLLLDESNGWRKSVEKDAFQFLSLCEKLKCCPDINNIHLWSNWLTPRTKSKRFDTLFFIASLPETPLSVVDDNEVDEIMWLTPRQLLKQNEEDLIVLPPPQLYEISRLLNFSDCCELLSFAKERSGQGCERWMPQYFQATDGPISLLPGDDGYHDDGCDGINLPIPAINMTKSEFRSKLKTLHRFEGKKILTDNYSPRNGHVLPMM